MARTLVVNAHWMGDVLFSTPALRALKKADPEGYLACLVPPRCEAVLKNNPCLDEVLVCEDRRLMWPPWRWTRAARMLNERRFDRVIFFHRSKTKKALAAAARIPDRAGYASAGRNAFLTRTVPPPSASLHRTDYFLGLIEALGVRGEGRAPVFFPSPGAESALDALFRKKEVPAGEPYVVVHAGGNWDLKRWPADFFADWIRLHLESNGGSVFLCGTRSEKTLSDRIEKRVRDKRLVSFCGETSLDELAVLLKNAKFLLSNDSGPIHVAASQRTPIVGVFGPTSPEMTGPISEGPVTILHKDVGCEVPCYYRSCNYRVCMDWITPREVFEATQKLAKKHV